jgi:hypothetical protein
MATLLGFVPKLLNWYNVDAGMEARPVGAVPVAVEVWLGWLTVVGGTDAGAEEAAPGKHWL